MKNHWILCAALVAGLSSSNGAAFTSNTQGQDLESIVIGLQAEVQELRSELENSQRVTRETVSYLQNMAKTAALMSNTLDTAEQKGFTAGINPASRETLLEGWRAQLSKLQKNVPTLETPKKVDEGRRSSQR